jgi:hypothetical protein
VLYEHGILHQPFEAIERGTALQNCKNHQGCVRLATHLLHLFHNSSASTSFSKQGYTIARASVNIPYLNGVAIAKSQLSGSVPVNNGNCKCCSNKHALARSYKSAKYRFRGEIKKMESDVCKSTK